MRGHERHISVSFLVHVEAIPFKLCYPHSGDFHAEKFRKVTDFWVFFTARWVHKLENMSNQVLRLQSNFFSYGVGIKILSVPVGGWLIIIAMIIYCNDNVLHLCLGGGRYNIQKEKPLQEQGDICSSCHWDTSVMLPSEPWPAFTVPGKGFCWAAWKTVFCLASVFLWFPKRSLRFCGARVLLCKRTLYLWMKITWF